MKQILFKIFGFPRTFCAWILFSLAMWFDKKEITNNDDERDFFEDIFDEIKDVNIEDIEEEDE